MERQEGYRLHAWGGDLRRESFEVPAPGDGEVLLEVEACGVGLTVLNCLDGDLSDDPGLLPRVPGHEVVGRVREVGPGGDRWLVGRRVVAYFYLSCGACRSCIGGNDARCLQLGGWIGVHRDGGYAPWTVLPAHNVIPVPDGLDAVVASVVPDAVATPLHVCETRARITTADRVVVIGAGGGVGVHMIQMARLMGGEVLGLDLGDRKLAAIEKYGASPVSADDLTALTPNRLPGGRPSVVIDLVGSVQTLAWSVETLEMGGRLIVLTTFRDRSLPLDPRELVFREISVLGSRYATRLEVARAAELVASGRILPVIGEVVGPDELAPIHAALRSGDFLGRGALSWAGHRS